MEGSKRLEEIGILVFSAYNKMKTTEEMYHNLYEELELEPENSIKLDEYNIEKEMASIRENIDNAEQRLLKEVDEKNIAKIKKNINETWVEAGILFGIDVNGNQSVSTAKKFNTELKNRFNKSFDRKVENVIARAKIDVLKKKANDIKNEKLSIFDKLKGKERLNESIIKSIQLKISKIRASVNNNKPKYELEETLADFYYFIEEELKGRYNNELQEFKKKVESSTDLEKLIDNTKFEAYLKAKKNNGQDSSINDLNLPMPYKQNKNKNQKKISYRKQARLIESQNIQIQKGTQISRAAVLKQQNERFNILEEDNKEKIIRDFQLKIRQIVNDTRIISFGGLVNSKQSS